MIGEMPSHRGVPPRVLVQESAPLRRARGRVVRAPGERARRRDEQFRSFVPDDVVAREMYHEGRAPHRKIGVKVIPLGARWDLPRPIAASGCRREQMPEVVPTRRR